MNEDWFQEAAAEAANSESAKRARAAAVEYEKRMKLQEESAKRLAQEKAARDSANHKSPTEVESARAELKAVAEGRRPPHTPEPKRAPRPGSPFPQRASNDGFGNSSHKASVTSVTVDAITPELGLEAIVRFVRKQPDPYKAVGEWITRTTAALSEVAREQDEE